MSGTNPQRPPAFLDRSDPALVDEDDLVSNPSYFPMLIMYADSVSIEATEVIASPDDLEPGRCFHVLETRHGTRKH